MLDNDMNASEREDLSRENKLLREENECLKKRLAFRDKFPLADHTIDKSTGNNIQEKSESFGEI